MKKTMITVSALSLVIIASASYAFGPGKQCDGEGHGRHGMHLMMAKYLALTDEQIEQIKAIRHEAHDSAKEKMLTVLSPEQQEKFKAFKAEMKEHKHQHEGEKSQAFFE